MFLNNDNEKFLSVASAMAKIIFFQKRLILEENSIRNIPSFRMDVNLQAQFHISKYYLILST